MTDITDLLTRYKQQSPGRHVDVESLIRNLGLGLEPSADLPENISGHIAREQERYVVRANGREHEYRRRFTMAHELGHYVLHRTLLDQADGVNDSKLYRTDINAPIYNSYITQIHEQQANSFAANLLMPADAVKTAHQELAADGRVSLKRLYQRFKVSPSAMRWRLKNLGLPYDDD